MRIEDRFWLRQRLVLALTRRRRRWAGHHFGHADETAGKLVRLLDRAARADAIAQHPGRPRREHDGRPRDWPARELEAAVLRVLTAAGAPVTVYRDGLAATIIADMLAVLLPQGPNERVHAVRRAMQRNKAIDRWAEIMESSGEPPRVAPRQQRQPRRSR